MTTRESHEQLADRAARSGDAAGAIRSLELAVEREPDRSALWIKLSAMRRAIGDASGALAAIERALALDPTDFSALLARAFLLEQTGNPRSDEAFGWAIAQLPPQEEIPAPMANAVAHAQARSKAWTENLAARLLAAAGTEGNIGERHRIERFALNSARRTKHFHQEPTHFHYPGLPEVEVHERASFPELEILEASFPVIRSEFESLLASQSAEMVPYIQYPDQVPLRQWQALNKNRDWSAIHLIQNGEIIENNARYCPKTMAALAQLPQPDVPGASPNAMFSLLAPNTQIPPHHGVANTRVVCHLALVVPQHCGFRVGDTLVEWREGEAFVFDDTIEHAAWNNSDRLRVVLICDLWAPSLSANEKHAVSAIIQAAGVGFTGSL